MAVAITSEQLIQDRITELRENSNFIDALLEDLAGYAIIVADFDGNVIAFSKSACKMYGYAADEVIGKKSIEIFSPQNILQPGKLVKIINELLEKESYSYQGEQLRRDGDIFPALISCTLTKDKKGKMIGIIQIVQDLSIYSRLEKRWWDSMSNFYQVVNNSADGILITSHEGTVRFTNPAMEFLLEKKAKDIQGQQFGFPISSGDKTEIDIIRKKGKTITAEMRVVETVWFDENVYLATLRDITERKKAQQEQENLTRMLQEKVSELEAFSYGVAHDLKSPIISIQGFLDLLKNDIRKRNAGKVKEDVQYIESGVKKMGQLIARTLEYSRAGRLVKAEAKVSFSEIVSDVIKEFTGQINSIQGTISAAKKFPEVYIDVIRIREVLTNLIQNSIKFRDKTRLLKIDISCQVAKSETIFFVRDNGIGIDTGEAEKMFGLFYRGSAEIEGTGVGLAIVKRIIEGHGGRVWAEGEPGKGTTIYFTLPQQS
jgi:PAS domain S-box-containing protein